MSLRTILIKTRGAVIERITGAVPTENNYTDADKEKLTNMTGGTLTPEQLAAIASQVPPTDISMKVDKVTGSALLATTEAAKIHSAGSDNQDLSNLVVKVANKSLVLDTEISKIHSAGSDNQDLSGLQPKETGKGLSANDLTTGLKTSYDGAVTHAGSAHAPSGATVGADWNTNVSNKPTIPEAQVNSDWSSVSGLSQILNKPTISAARLYANLLAPVVTSGTTEKVLLQLQIPANSAIVGSTYRAWIIGNSSSTGTLIFKVRCGAGGTITDTIDWTAVTSAAQVANARAGFDVLITIRSATTIKAEGVGYAGAVQLPTTIAAPTTPAIVISGVWYINLTVICSSGTFTAQVGNIEEIK